MPSCAGAAGRAVAPYPAPPAELPAPAACSVSHARTGRPVASGKWQGPHGQNCLPMEPQGRRWQFVRHLFCRQSTLADGADATGTRAAGPATSFVRLPTPQHSSFRTLAHRGSLDDVPCAGSKGAKGAEGDGLVGVVQRLGPDDLVVVLVLLAPVLVRSVASPAPLSACCSR